VHKQSLATQLTRQAIERKEKSVGIRFSSKRVKTNGYIIGLSESDQLLLALQQI
jgi:hypothetical protein